MTSKPTAISGTSKIKPYPKFLPIEYLKQLIGKVIYLIEKYEPGFAIKISVKSGSLTLYSWDGELLDPNDHHDKLIYAGHLYSILKHIRINDAVFYFGKYDDMIALVDIHYNEKMSSPGMIRDLFSKTVMTQKIIKIIPLSDDDYKNFSHDKNIVIKPATFKLIDCDGFRPLYIN